MRSLRDDSGLSLTELLVVSVLISVILAGTYFMLSAATSMTDLAMARASAADEAQAAIDLIAREVRQAQEDDEDPAPGVFWLAGASDMKITSDTDHDTRPELIRYYVEDGALKRTVALPTNTEMPFTYGTPGAPRILVRELGTSAGPVFCYHDKESDVTALCGTVDHKFNVVATGSPHTTTPKIVMVGIKIDAVGNSGDKTVTVISRALVRMRTIENAVE